MLAQVAFMSRLDRAREAQRKTMKTRHLHPLHAIPGRRLPAVLRVALLSVLLLGGPIFVARSEPAPDLPKPLSFDIVRKGATIGHHLITFRRNGETLHVHSDVNFRVKVLFITAFQYTQKRDEAWRDGKLIAFASQANDNGKTYDIKGKAEANGIRVTSGAQSWLLPSDGVPASFWNMSMVTAKGPLVDAQDGRVTKARFVRIGKEKIVAGGRQIDAIHYRLVTKTPRDIWYDATGRWVKMRISGKDGSVVDWVLRY
jgi:Family of unknown function (DUF6134)